jgi:hypothetical protein
MLLFIRRSLIAAEMQARQLLRRRLALVILVALPVALYLSMLTNGKESAIQFGTLGMAWSVASAALFSVLAASAAEPRLVLAGYRADELMLGRFLLLLGIGVVLATIGAVAMTVVSAPVSEGSLLTACALVPLVAVPLGLAIAALLPRDLEGVLIIIGVVGMQLSLNQSAWVNLLLPLDGPVQLAYRAGGLPADPAGPMLVHALASTIVLLGIAAGVGSRRMRVRHPEAHSRRWVTAGVSAGRDRRGSAGVGRPGRLPAAEDQGHRAVVHQFDLHVSSELAGGDDQSQASQGGTEALAETPGQVGWGRSDEAGPVAARRVRMKGELAHHQDRAPGLQEVEVHPPRLVGADAQSGDPLGKAVGGGFGVAGAD